MSRRTLATALTLTLLAGGLIVYSMSRGTATLVAADVIGAFGFHAGEDDEAAGQYGQCGYDYERATNEY